MKARIKKLWVDALRSGDYQQTTGRLRRETHSAGTGFCCLGVLCNLHAQEHPEIAAKETNPGIYINSSSLPPAAVLRWAGIPSTDDSVTVMYKGKHTDLVSLNDTAKLSFKKIANVIERCL
jgi:hypothetical protein